MRLLKFGVIAVLALSLTTAQAGYTTSVQIDGGDAIWLAGRTDVIVPAASSSWSFLIRHGGPTPEEIQETHPDLFPISGGDTLRVLDPAVGGISFYNGFGSPYFGPDGNGASGSNLSAIGGISGYRGPQGPLVGVFLDDSIPTSGAPATLNFDPSGLGTDFLSLNPELGQVFYIGNGVTSGGDFQEFIAPAGATRFGLAIPDGFGFVGYPGAYDDNDGSYQVRIGVNEIPVDPTVPVPSSLLLVSLGVCGIRQLRRKLS
jgi:hypothetical protein